MRLATSLASPQMPTVTGFVRPMRSALMSTWMTLPLLRPVVDAVAGQRRKRIEPRAERQHDVGLGDELHRRFRAVVAERPDGKPMAAGEAVVVLVVVANRRIEFFGKCRAFGNGAAEDDAGARQDHREFRLRQQARGFGNRLATAGRSLELDDVGSLMSMTWVQKSRGMLICAGADRRLALVMTRFRTSAVRDSDRALPPDSRRYRGTAPSVRAPGSRPDRWYGSPPAA